MQAGKKKGLKRKIRTSSDSVSVSKLSHSVNSAPRKSIGRIDLKNRPQILSTESILFRALIEKSTLQKHRDVAAIVFQHLRGTLVLSSCLFGSKESCLWGLIMNLYRLI